MRLFLTSTFSVISTNQCMLFVSIPNPKVSMFHETISQFSIETIIKIYININIRLTNHQKDFKNPNAILAYYTSASTIVALTITKDSRNIKKTFE